MTVTTQSHASAGGRLPFSGELLDRLLDSAGIEVLIVTSKHNIRYLLGGHYHHFFESMDAIGISRYLPVLIYVKGRPDQAAYIGFKNEADMLGARSGEQGPLWPPVVRTAASSALEAMDIAVEHIRRIGAVEKRVAVEPGFLPSDASERLLRAFPRLALRDGLRALELLRAVKSKTELDLLRQASESVVDAMLAVIAKHGAGSTKRAIVKALQIEETFRGLTFDYALVTVGSSHNRAPSDEVWQAGDILSLDSGGNLDGYIGDLCRMAILGEPDAELQDLLAEVDQIQSAARRGVKPGSPGIEIYAEAQEILSKSKYAKDLRFVAHGMGLVSHEVPHLTASGPVPYPASDAQRPLVPGMVISVETTLLHPVRGFIKLEDTIAVTQTGWEGFGDRGRGWNIGAG